MSSWLNKSRKSLLLRITLSRYKYAFSSPSSRVCESVCTCLRLCGRAIIDPMNSVKEANRKKKLTTHHFPAQSINPRNCMIITSYSVLSLVRSLARSPVSIFISVLVGIDNCHFEITIILFEADMRVSGPFSKLLQQRKQWRSKFIFILNLFFKWFINLLFQFFLFFHLFSFSLVFWAHSIRLHCTVSVCECVFLLGIFFSILLTLTLIECHRVRWNEYIFPYRFIISLPLSAPPVSLSLSHSLFVFIFVV